MLGHRSLAQSLAVIAFAFSSFVPAVAQAQSANLGTFRWQLQPYCNVLTLSIVQDGSLYHLDGTDDQCGAQGKAGVVGLAFPNPDGSIGFGMTTITTPGGIAVHIDATVSVATVSGTWRDSAGNSGALALTAGPGTGGARRPSPSDRIPAGSATTTELANGAVTAAKIAPGSVDAAALAPLSVTGAAVAPGSLRSAHLADAPRVTHASGGNIIGLNTSPKVVRAVTIDAPGPGKVMLNATGSFQFGASGTTVESARCSLTTGTALDLTHFAVVGDGGAVALAFGSWAINRIYDVGPGTLAVNVVCEAATDANVLVVAPSVSALFVPQ